MRLPYHNIEIEVPFEGLIDVECFELKESLNAHAVVKAKFLADEDKIESLLLYSDSEMKIAVMEKEKNGAEKLIFSGKAVRFFVEKEQALSYLWAEFSTYTKEWDITPKSQSFCSLTQPYSEVIKEVIGEYSQKDIKDEVTNGMAIQDMLLQYEESDWEFLKRLASHFSTFLVVDSTMPYGRVYFGLPAINYGNELENGEYQMSRNQKEYDRICLSKHEYGGKEILPQELIRWFVCCRKRFYIAETIMFNGVETIVTGIYMHTANGELITEYELCRKSGVLCDKKKNSRIYGMSIPATVKERSGNRIRVQMDIDQGYCASESLKYFTYAIESSSIYCMPEENSRVHIYFPSHDEKDAIAVHAISSGKGAGRSPANKSFTTPSGMAMDMKPDSYSFNAGGSSLSIGTDGIVSLQGTTILFTTAAQFSVGEETPAENIVAESQTTFNLQVGGTSINMAEDAKIVASFVYHAATKKTTPDPSPDAVIGLVTANDSAILAEANAGAEQYLMALGEKRSAAKAEVRHGFFDAIGTILVVGVIAATGGIAAAPIALVVAFSASNRVMSDVAEIHHGVTEWSKADRGDLSETDNLFQTTLGMSDAEYAKFIAINNFVFDVVSMSAITVNISSIAFSNISNCTVKAMAKMASMGAISGGKSVIDEFAATGGFNLQKFLINTAIGSISGGLGGFMGNAAIKAIGKAGYQLPSLAQMLVRSAVGGIAAGTTDAGMRSWLEDRELSLEEYYQIVMMYASGMLLSDVTTDLMGAHDPIHTATGAFLANETDLVFPDIREPISWKRSYDSSRRLSGMLGIGWTVPFEGKLYTNKENQIHVIVPQGALVIFECRDDGYHEIGKRKGRYGLICDEARLVWTVTDYHTHQTLQYQKDGMLSVLTDRNGQDIKLSYDNGNLSSLVTSLGHRLKFRFAEGKLMEASDETGRTVRYYYSGSYLSRVVNPSGGSIWYEYSEEGYLIKATDPSGVTYLVNKYDHQGRVESQILKDGDTCILEYQSELGRTIAHTSQGDTIYEYNKENMPVCITYPDQSDLRFGYNENHDCIYRKDRLGNEQIWNYDGFARIIYEKTPGGLESFHEYDAKGNLVKTEDSGGRKILLRYDAGHNVIEKKELLRKEPQEWRTTMFEYDAQGRLVKKTQSAGKSISYHYRDGCGKPISTIYGDGQEVRREYDQMERMMVKEDSCGRTEYGYNSVGDMSFVRGGEGNETLCMYDSMGRLLYLYPPKANRNTGEGATHYRYNFMRYLDDTIHPDGTHERQFLDWEGTVLKKVYPNSYDPKIDDGEGEIYERDCNKNLIRILYPDGGVERFFRDAEGNCIKHILPEDYDEETDDGPGYCYEYDAESRLCRIVNPEGAEEVYYEYDIHGNLSLKKTADGGVSYYWYNLCGDIIQKAEAVSKTGEKLLFRRTSYSYDSDGNKTRECRYGGSWKLHEVGERRELEREEPGEELCLLFSYDVRGRLTQVEDGKGACVRYAYDVRGNLIREEQKISDDVWKKVYYKLDKEDRLVEKREIIDTGFRGELKDTRISAITTYKHDQNGNIIQICTPEGHQIYRQYDLRDRLLCERTVDEKNGIDRSVSVTYDRAGNILALCRKGADTESHEITYDYDLKNRLIHAKDVQGAVFEYAYDKNDRLIEEQRPSAEAQSSCYYYQYDMRGNLVERKNPRGETEVRNRYDAMGRLTGQSLADGEEVSVGYGLHGEAETYDNVRSQAEGVHAQSYSYNSRGQVTGIIDGNHNRTVYELDAWGKILEVKAADGGKECYSYDYAGNITSTSDANGGVITYRYNSQGKVCEILDQEGKRQQYFYDKEGHPVLSIDRLGNRVETEYNVDGNPVREISCDKDGDRREIRTWLYDSLGHLKESVGGGFRYQYRYLPDGKLLEKASNGKPVLAYTYYPDGSIKTMTDVTGKPLAYRYDETGRLSSIRDYMHQEIVGYSHTPGGKLQEIRHQSGVRTTFLYDKEGNITRLTTRSKEGRTICDLQYEYDLNGNRTAKKGSMVLPEKTGSLGLQLRNIRYGYDSQNRLISEQTGGYESFYRYDLCGNRLEKNGSEGREVYSYNCKNQLTGRKTREGNWQYHFDGQGNLVKETSASTQYQYEYDPGNRQTAVWSEGVKVQENLYDGENLRAGLVERGKRSTFVFHKGEIVGELDDRDTLVKGYIRGYGAAAINQDGTYYGVHQDEQLSTGWITRADGTVENAYEYDAFGKLLGSHVTITNRLLYAGQQYDQESGQYYLRARYYNPVVGRFMQEDPYRGDGLNLYAYCGNNPVCYYDPSGYTCELNGQAEENAKKENVTEGGSGALLDNKLMSELAESGVKYNVDDVIMVTKTADGKLVWLEKGSDSAGLKHIINNHATNFADRGITDIPKFLEETLKSTPTRMGSSSKGMFAEYIINGKEYTVAYGNNGFIVSFYPSGK